MTRNSHCWTVGVILVLNCDRYYVELNPHKILPSGVQKDFTSSEINNRSL